MIIQNKIIEKRNLIVMILLMFVTLGFYFFYWQYKTKEEINKLGGSIPTFWFAIIPFLNIYFDYRYAQDFTRIIRKEDDTIFIVMLTLLLAGMPFFGALIAQYELNKYRVKKYDETSNT